MKLKPCPFCGSEDIEIFESNEREITKCRCYNCFSGATEFDNRRTVYRGNEAKERAIEAWNTRYEPS